MTRLLGHRAAACDLGRNVTQGSAAVSRSVRASVQTFAPQHQRVLDRVRVVAAPHAGHRKPEPLVQLRAASFERRTSSVARARAEPRAFAEHVRAAAPSPTPARRYAGSTARLLMCSSSSDPPERAEADDVAGASSAREIDRTTRPWFSSSARYISRVHGLVNDASSIARIVVDLGGDVSGSMIQQAAMRARQRAVCRRRCDLRVRPPDVQRLDAGRVDRLPARARAPPPCGRSRRPAAAARPDARVARSASIASA